MAPVAGRHYRIKLKSGRVLGPLDMGRVRKLVRKNHVTGAETARELPDGEWKDINLIPELAELFIAKAEGRLDQERTEFGIAVDPQPLIHQGPTQVLPEIPQGATLVLPADPLPEPAPESPDPAPHPPPVPDDERTSVADFEPESFGAVREEITRTEAVLPDESASPRAPEGADESDASVDEHDPRAQATRRAPAEPPRETRAASDLPAPRNIAEEKTVVFHRSAGPQLIGGPGAGGAKGRRKSPVFQKVKAVAMVVAVLLIAHEALFEEDDRPAAVRPEVVRPRLPASKEKALPDPARSQQIYGQAMKFYLQDNVEGYRRAARLLQEAAALDLNNVKVLAMLASSYLNLIDDSNKDENYFSVISRLIDMSRAKNVELPETVIADVEFYINSNRAEAAQLRIVDYTKTHRSFGPEMFFYLAYAFYMRGDIESAARYIAEFPENRVYSPRIYYLRGLIAERSSPEEAMVEYRKAVKYSPNHARSRLRIAALLSQQGKLKDAADHLEFLMRHRRLLAPQELAQAYYLHAQLCELFEKWDFALHDVERAVVLDRDNHDYLLEQYSLRARLGDKDPSLKKDARMYYYLGEGERQVRKGAYHEALTFFLQARQANMESPLPPVKAGDMFYQMKDMSNARMNYETAAKLAPKSIDIWSKFIDTLIQSYEWQQAKKALDRFRDMHAAASMIDKLAGDMYARQGRHDLAQTFYRKAMGRELIDPKVYVAYADSLLATKNFKDAPFFFALALRYDPLNTQAIIGTAKCIAGTDSIDRAISMLQDELQRGTSSKAELLSAVAELQIQKGEWELAQSTLDRAMAANPDLADPWRLQARIYLSKENTERGALDRALSAYKSYSDRNASDPSGYLERYRMFVRKLKYEQAGQELERIYAIYPKYPNLHFYKGALYALMGNHREAISEFKIELTNNPGNLHTLLALGKEYIELGVYNDALAQFNQAMGLAPNASEPKHMSAYANYLLKNYSGAVALFQAAIQLDQANPLLYKRLGMAYRAMGDMPGARAAFRKYLEMEPDAPDKAEFQSLL